MSIFTDDYMWNVSIAECCALTFCAFPESCRIGVPASFCNNLHMRLVNDRNLGVSCAVPSRVRELIEHLEIFRLMDLPLSTLWSVTWLYVR